jgi:hypothetical protein
MNEIKLTEIEVSKLSLQPGDVLFFKIISSGIDDSDFQAINKVIQDRFPNNKIMVMVFPPGDDLEIYQMTQAKKAQPVSNCAEPTSYCNDCSCGKKERIEASDGSNSEPNGQLAVNVPDQSVVDEVQSIIDQMNGEKDDNNRKS